MSPTLRRHRALEGALIGLLLCGIAANLWAMRVAKSRVYTVPPPTPLPLTVSGWKGAVEPDDLSGGWILPHARVTTVHYEKPQQQPVDLVVIASRDPNDMHTPDRCILGGGYQIVSDEPCDLRLPGPEGGSWALHRLRIRQHGQDDQLVLYGYDGIHALGNSTLMARIAMKLGGARRDPAYFLRLSAPVGEDAAATKARLMDFAADLLRDRHTWQTPTTGTR
jgi:hypothetical protein